MMKRWGHVQQLRRPPCWIAESSRSHHGLGQAQQLRALVFSVAGSCSAAEPAALGHAQQLIGVAGVIQAHRASWRAGNDEALGHGQQLIGTAGVTQAHRASWP